MHLQIALLVCGAAVAMFAVFSSLRPVRESAF